MDRLHEASSPAAFHNSIHRFDPPKCHPNTRTALLERLMEWCIGSVGMNDFILWLYGPAGAGKSAIVQTFAERCAMANLLLATFFFSRTDPTRNSDKSLAATLAYQMAIAVPGIRNIIESAIERDPLIFQRNFASQFATLIINPLLQLSNIASGGPSSDISVPYLIIIDGLDECHASDVQQSILDTISSTLHRHRTVLHLKFLIASRPESHLTTTFTAPSMSNLTSRLALHNVCQSYADIRLYLIDSFTEIRETHVLRTQIASFWPSGNIIDKLVVKSSGQFVYAATVIRYVSSPRHNPLDRLKVILGLRLPSKSDKPYAQLDALYTGILSCVDDVETTIRILGFVLFATPPGPGSITAFEIEDLMLLDRGTVRLLLLDLASIIDIGGSTNTVRFLHASFGDFLLDPARSLSYNISPRQAHGEIARLCCYHIKVFWDSGPLRSALSSEVLLYAFRNLACHIQYAKESDHDLREEVLNVPFVQCLQVVYKYCDSRGLNGTINSTEILRQFLEKLMTSPLSNTMELYLHHRHIYSQSVLDALAQIPDDYERAFCIASVGLEFYEPDDFLISYITFEALLGLKPSSEVIHAARIIYYNSSVPGSEDHLRGGVVRRIAADNHRKHILGLLTDSSRAGPYILDGTTHAVAAEFLLAFAFRPWDDTKYDLGQDFRQWEIICDLFTQLLSQATHSELLVGELNRSVVTLCMGRPNTNSETTLRLLFRALEKYLIRYTGSIPEGFHVLIVSEQRRPNLDVMDYTNDFDDEGVYYIDSLT